MLLRTTDYDLRIPAAEAEALHTALRPLDLFPELLEVAEGVRVAVPAIGDLIRTKRFAARPKDTEDIRLLRALEESLR